MKRLTTFFVLIFVSISTFFCCGATISNDDYSTPTPTWVRITNEETWLYKNPTQSQSDKLFLLAYSYYAKVLQNTQNGFYYVELMENSSGFVKIYGYVLQESVSPVAEPPVSPTYPMVFTTVTQNNLILFSQPTTSSASVCAVYQGQTLYYFGSFPINDKTWYFVRFGQNLCYVDSMGVTAPAISLHPTPLPVEPVLPPEEEPTPIPTDTVEEPQKDFSSLQIAVTALVALSAVVIVIVLFLPAKSKKQNYENCDATACGTSFHQSREYNQPKPRYFDDFL